MKSLFVTMLFLLPLTGCNTMEGVGEDLQDAGEALEEEASD